MTYPISYVLTDADHLANSAGRLLSALNAKDGTDAALEIGRASEDQATAAREALSEHFSATRSAIYEYQKRAQRYRESIAASPTLAAAGSGCRWVFMDPDSACVWESACGVEWQFTEGGPTENGVKFCVGCGKPVI